MGVQDLHQNIFCVFHDTKNQLQMLFSARTLLTLILFTFYSYTYYKCTSYFKKKEHRKSVQNNDSIVIMSLHESDITMAFIVISLLFLTQLQAHMRDSRICFAGPSAIIPRAWAELLVSALMKSSTVKPRFTGPVGG